MSARAIILNRMLNEPVFAEAVFKDAAQALAEYQLSNEDLARFKALSRADFEALGWTDPTEVLGPLLPKGRSVTDTYPTAAAWPWQNFPHFLSRSQLMSSNDLQTLVTKIMTDEAFVNALASDPAAALQSAGITPTAEMLEALQGTDVAAIKQMAASFGEEKAAG